jgi:hypothetical protein
VVVDLGIGEIATFLAQGNQLAQPFTLLFQAHYLFFVVLHVFLIFGRGRHFASCLK